MAATDKRVSFNTVTIAEFPTDLGHNPSRSTGGPPVSIGWREHESTNTVNFELYEHCRKDQRRRGAALIIPSSQRMQMLHKAGFTPLKIARATVEADALLRDRLESNKRNESERRSKTSPRTTQRKSPSEDGNDSQTMNSVSSASASASASVQSLLSPKSSPDGGKSSLKSTLGLLKRTSRTVTKMAKIPLRQTMRS